MAQYVVSFDVDWSEHTITGYRNTRDAIVETIEQLPHVKVMQTFYVVGIKATEEQLANAIMAEVGRKLSGYISNEYRLCALVKGRGSRHWPGDPLTIAAMDILDVQFPPEEWP